MLWWSWVGYAWLTSVIALGESIVAIGVAARAQIDLGIVTAAILGIVVAATLWWVYFDVTATPKRGIGCVTGLPAPTPPEQPGW